MLGGIVGGIPPPERSEREAEGGGEIQRPAPAESHHEPGDERTGQSGTQVQGRARERVRECPPGDGKPGGDRPAHDRKDGGLRRPEDEPQHEEARENRRRRGEEGAGEDAAQHREEGPQDQDRGESKPGSYDLSEESPGKLKERVPPDGAREDPAQLQIGEPELRPDLEARDRDVLAKDVGEERDETEQRENLPADGVAKSRGARGGDGSRAHGGLRYRIVAGKGSGPCRTGSCGGGY